MATVSQLLQRASELQNTSDTAQLDCEILLCHLLRVDRSWLRTWPDGEVSPQQVEQFEELLAARIQGKPIAHLIGSRGFWTLDLKVTADTLIPRPETEHLVELALALPLPDDSGVLDLGTGTGAIALALAAERSNWQLTAVDYQPKALVVARENCQRHQLSNVQIIESNWFSNITAQTSKFDLIVSNPPYIHSDDPHLHQGDLRFEPISALASGADGLEDLRRIISQSREYLNAKGWLLVEHGYQQGPAVRELFTTAGFTEVNTQRDYNQLERITFGQWL